MVGVGGERATVGGAFPEVPIRYDPRRREAIGRQGEFVRILLPQARWLVFSREAELLTPADLLARCRPRATAAASP